MLVAAVFYSLATVRLSRLAPNVPSLPLATAKSLALAGASVLWLGASALNKARPLISKQLLCHHLPPLNTCLCLTQERCTLGRLLSDYAVQSLEKQASEHDCSQLH